MTLHVQQKCVFNYHRHTTVLNDGYVYSHHSEKANLSETSDNDTIIKKVRADGIKWRMEAICPVV